MDSTTPPPLVPQSPPPFMAPPPPPKKRPWGWIVFGIVFVLFVGLVVVGEALAAFGRTFVAHESVRMTTSKLHEVSIENPDSDEKVAVIDIDGIITSSAVTRHGRSMVESVKDELAMAEKDPEVKAVILRVDSPGGEVMASDDIARAVRQFQARSDKPVIASMSSVAASGGYYVSAPCRFIVASDLTITGSIGVIMQSLNYRGLMDKVGVVPQTYKSGRLKDMMSGSKKPEDADPLEKEILMGMIMETYERFAKVVSDGRSASYRANSEKSRKLAADWKDYADGRILTGTKAFELGFVDELGDFETAVAVARRLARISTKAHLIRYQEPFSWDSVFSMFGQSPVSERGVKVDLGLDLPKLRSGLPYYILSTSVP